MSQPPVVILGSGLGGLTLARCLRHRGISSVIYECASPAQRNTYGITLYPWAYKPLLTVFGIDEHTFRRRVAVDSFNHDAIGRVSSGDAGTSTPFRANRNKLESMLREGQTIRLEHSLSSAVIPADDGKVKLSFQNGLNIHPPLAVDVLGVHSQLRKSLLPGIALEVQPFAVYSCKRYIKADLFSSLYSPAFGDGNVIVREPERAGDPRLEITVNEHQPNGNVSISYIYSRAARKNGVDVDPLHNPDRPIGGATDIPEEFYKELDDYIKTSNPSQPFKDCFDIEQLRSERPLHWLMRTIMVPKQDLLNLLHHGIVMIGDSVHAVPILGGLGANMAISDATKLAEVLGKNQDLTPVQAFYEDNWQDWHTAVEDSKKKLAEIHKGATDTVPSL